MTFVPIVIGAFGTITKGLLKGLENLEVGGRVETIQMTALLRTARILRRVLETCCHSKSSEKPSANTDLKSSKGVIIINIIIINNNNNNNNPPGVHTARIPLTLSNSIHPYHSLLSACHIDGTKLIKVSFCWSANTGVSICRS